jgi:NAD+ diphosphatase
MTTLPFLRATPNTGSPSLDRVDHLRADDAALAALQSDIRARVLKLEGLDPVLTAEGELEWGSLADIGVDAALILLGLREDIPYFAPLNQDTATAPLFRSPRIMHAMTTLPADDLVIYSTARSLIDWHARHGFCGKCGTATASFRAGWGRHCTGCNTEHFPRTDPVVIMIAEHQGRALVGRNVNWPEGRYSALAGFLEPGETVEHAVARELYEEAGMRATSVRYVMSQHWPFPSQLMLACVAQVESDALTLAHAELADAIWVTPAEVRAALAGEVDARFLAPPRYAVAHTLMREWAGD